MYMYIIILKIILKHMLLTVHSSLLHGLQSENVLIVQHFFGNVADLLSSLFHGIPVYSTPNSQYPWLSTH